MLDTLLIKEMGEPDELEAFFLQALYWSIGAALLEDGRIKFDAQIKNLAAMSTASDDEKNFAKAGICSNIHLNNIRIFKNEVHFYSNIIIINKNKVKRKQYTSVHALL